MQLHVHMLTESLPSVLWFMMLRPRHQAMVGRRDRGLRGKVGQCEALGEMAGIWPMEGTV